MSHAKSKIVSMLVLFNSLVSLPILFPLDKSSFTVLGGGICLLFNGWSFWNLFQHQENVKDRYLYFGIMGITGSLAEFCASMKMGYAHAAIQTPLFFLMGLVLYGVSIHRILKNYGKQNKEAGFKGNVYIVLVISLLVPIVVVGREMVSLLIDGKPHAQLMSNDAIFVFVSVALFALSLSFALLVTNFFEYKKEIAKDIMEDLQ